MLPEDVELKQELVMMSPPASDSGSGSPPQFSPYCVDSEPGSPLLDHEQVTAKSWMQGFNFVLFDLRTVVENHCL